MQAVEQGATSALNARDLMAQTQMRSQQAQAQALANQEAQRDQADQEFMKQQFLQNPDPAAFDKSIRGQVSPKAYLGWQQKDAEVKTQHEALTTHQLVNEGHRNDISAGAMRGVFQLPPEQRDAAWTQTLDGLAQKNVLTADEVQKMKAAYPTAPTDPTTQQALLSMHMLNSAYVANELAKRKVGVEESNAAANTSNALVKKNEYETKAPGEKAKAAQEARANVAGPLAEQAEGGADSYMQGYHQLAPEQQAQLPTPQEFDPEKTPRAVRFWGLTPDQQGKARTAEAQLKKVGSEAELANRAANGDTNAKKAMEFLTDVKVREAIGKALGPMNAILNGGTDTPAAAPQSGAAAAPAEPPVPGAEPVAVQPSAPTAAAAPGAAQPGAAQPPAGAIQIQPASDGSFTATLPDGLPVRFADEGKLKQFEARVKQQGGVTARTPAGQPQGAAPAGPGHGSAPAPVPPNATNATAPGGPEAAAPQVGTRNEAVLAKINPAIANEVRAIADGRLPLPATSRMNPMNEVKRNLLMKYDPMFDFTNASARVKTAQSFSPGGQQGQAINAFDTALRHASVLVDLADKLDNGPLRKLNSISNWMKTETGSPDVKRFENVRGKFAEEMTKAWRGTGGTQANINAELDVINAADSPAALRKVLADDVELLGGKIGALEDQYQQTMNKPGKFITPTAQKAIEKIKARAEASSAAGAFKVTDPNGRRHTFKTQADADAFKAAAKIQ